MRSDQDLLRALARHLRKFDVSAFNGDDDEQERAQHLLERYAGEIDNPCQVPGCPAGPDR